MPRQDISGVETPIGSDAFNPTAQFITWQDGNAAYNNRLIVPLDTDRTALTTPELRDGLEVYVEATKKLWLYDGSWHHIGGISHVQADTTNSTEFMVTQWGMGKIAGAAAASITEGVTFPVAFASVPFIQTGYIGARTTSAYNPAGLTDFAGDAIGKGYTPSTTGLSVLVHRTGGANLASGWDFYYSWSATGVLA